MSTSVLSPLGIYGWEKIENPLLACIVLGEPVMLVSEPGAAKTYFGEVLAKALSYQQHQAVKYGYYDTSKTNFEDFIGFPNPEAFKQGKAEFIHNELTIWDKNVIMLDEISRASRDTSNKWLEVTGSRMLMGKPLPLVAVLGAMNPVSHHATHLLDQAFADRFLAFIPLPKYTDMDEDIQNDILSSSTGLDAPSLNFWQNTDWHSTVSHQYVVYSEAWGQAAVRLRDVLAKASKQYQQLSPEVIKSVENYLRKFAALLSYGQGGINLEARRLKMIKRVILASWVVSGVRENKQINISQVTEDVLSYLFPQEYTGAKIDHTRIIAAHTGAKYLLSNETGSSSEIISLDGMNHISRFKSMLNNPDKWSLAMKEKAISSLEIDPKPEAFFVASFLLSLSNINAQIVDMIPATYWARLAEKVKLPDNSFSLKSEHISFIHSLIQGSELDKLILQWTNAQEAKDWAENYQKAKEITEIIKTTFQPFAENG